MKNLAAFYSKNKKAILLILGLIGASLLVLPYFLLGESSYVEIHDQLDGEVLNYIYRAKYFLRGDIIPEFMNGMNKASMAMPAPFGILFYKFLPPFYAFVIMQWMGVLVGFTGMYFLCLNRKVCPEIGFIVALLFAYLPFYPVYGLANFGQPLLVLCALQLKKKDKWIPSLLGIMLYAGFSSLALIGYVWISFGLLYVVIATLLEKKKSKNIMPLFVRLASGWAVLLCTYLLTNIDILKSLFGNVFETHRQEMVLRAVESPIYSFCENAFQGSAYNKTYSIGIFLAVVALTLFWRLKSKSMSVEPSASVALKSFVTRANVLTITILVLVLLVTLWSCAPIIALRETLGGIITYFQADRVSWLFPFLWLLVLAFVLQGLLLLHKCVFLQKKKLQSIIIIVLSLLLVVAEGGQILRDSTLNKNARFLLFDNYEQITWKSFFMDDVFEELDALIGDKKNQVSVVSLGLYPSIPLYHGYTCADGYSNNYDLPYKHTFREIIADELAKDAEVKSYFDDWGNRLYLASAQYGFNALMKKQSDYICTDFSLNSHAMKDLNIGYLISAIPIQNPEQTGLRLITDTPLSTPDSYFEIWLYEVE